MKINELAKGSRIHLMGICGTAMASLAGLLKDRGFKVQGSDQNPYPPMSTQLEKLSIPIMKGYSRQNLHPQPDYVIVGNVISRGNEEADELLKLGIPYTSLPQAIGEFIIADREAIVISGTHGKTTTTALTAWLLSGFEDPLGFLVGGIPKNFSQSFQNPSGKYFVIEGDEYDTAFFDKVPKFTHYRPRHVILTSVEFDHADIYKDLNAVEAAFYRLAELIPSHGNLFYWADDKTVSKIAAKSKSARFGYGFEQGDYRAKIIDVSERGIRFDIQFRGKSIAPDSGLFYMQLSGTYNVLNATASLALCHQLGFDMKVLTKRLADFLGVKRRQEVLGEPGGVLVIEDFAHHPTAVRETILGIQKKYPGKKFFSVFEPRSATSRRKVFQQDYVNAFTSAQEILIASAFDQSKIDTENRFSSQELVEDLKARGKSACCYNSVDEIVAAVAEKSKPGDGVLIMSNGGFDGIYTKILQALEKAHE